jgi:type I restriction enzyme M protein
VADTRQLDESTLPEWLWDAACQIRGPVNASKCKDYILPPVFIKQHSDVFEDEISYLAHEFGERDLAATLVEDDHDLVRFDVPHSARRPVI